MSETMEAQGTVGPRVLSDGVVADVRLVRTGEVAVAHAHARCYEAVSRGKCFHASMQAGGALGTALTATAVTLTVYNPLGSGVNAVMWRASLGITTFIAAAGSAVYVYAVNTNTLAAAPTGLTAATVRNCLLGAPAGQVAAYTAATLPAAPVVGGILGSTHVVGATPVSESSFSLIDWIDGSITLTPNTSVTLQGIGAASSGISSFMWEEVPLV